MCFCPAVGPIPRRVSGLGTLMHTMLPSVTGLDESEQRSLCQRLCRKKFWLLPHFFWATCAGPQKILPSSAQKGH